MANRTIFAKQITEGGRDEGRILGPFEGFYPCGEARFNRTGLTCYFEGRTFRKLAYPHWTNTATHSCLEDGEAHLIREVESCDADHRRTFLGKFRRSNRKG